jgi:hypothetical protein
LRTAFSTRISQDAHVMPVMRVTVRVVSMFSDVVLTRQL